MSLSSSIYSSGYYCNLLSQVVDLWTEYQLLGQDKQESQICHYRHQSILLAIIAISSHKSLTSYGRLLASLDFDASALWR